MNTVKIGVVRVGQDDIIIHTNLDQIKYSSVSTYDALSQKNILCNYKTRTVSRDQRRIKNAEKSIANVFCCFRKLEESDIENFLFKREKIESC
ncbi:hypothetical protein UFOVP733_9 [uncultured Caudovirales phage]|uniref:Uncharacterized protein n=1 Tax=uncultured Caudovirales phage TaxID=2100421 RepID=A0A6J7X5U1_9CAUD|nr:hypothetical protein UFOVP733_9 [uncultured Caudovirales phage]CAB5224960.1 hypothetical protein UFOVP743_50 [uncultured Caudovirales phage]